MYSFVITTATLAQSFPLPPSWIKEFPFSVGLLIVIVMLLWWFIKSSEKRFEKRDDESRKYSEARERNILKESEVRERAYGTLVNSFEELVRRLSADWRETNYKLDRNYQDAINKFVTVIKEQGEQNSYAIQVLTELKGKIEKHSESHHASTGDFIQLKKDIIEVLEKMGLEYNLTPKERKL